ncbi:MAG TPA: citrate/2-methylcitrate synthase [Candidatus Hydrogenedentes bacterium]|nr:citrate/2-methylcitrate synthase [Candidatus Hydrogenedentota bacterium]HNT87595.1 citrate/2-methylcitrate synthase [Candidatus Hydrogenedentota bacterium]
MTMVYSPGLDGVVAGETRVSCVDQGRLLYRGYAIQELAEKTNFEEVLHLMLYGELPGEERLQYIMDRLDDFRALPEQVYHVLQHIPATVPMMEVVRTMVSFAGHFDPVEGDDDEAIRQRAIWLTAQVPSIIAARHRLLNGDEPVKPRRGMSHAAQMLYLLFGEEPDDMTADLLDLTLVLYAEHEFNASTFTCRVICSTESDLVSSVAGAIGALKGPLHGGANEAAMRMLLRFKSADEAAKWVVEALERKEKIMGFGHRVYRHGDHRAHILEQKMRKLAHKKGQDHWLAIYDAVRDPVRRLKNIYPNVDYPCGLTYHLMGLPLDLFTPIFVSARVSGWSAHYLEQSRGNRLYRPLSEYIGQAERTVPPLDER